jgi:hypothetical protein
MTEPWMDMNNDISVDIKTLQYDNSTNLLLGRKLPKSLITKLDDRTHLFPFKIVTLGWLILKNLYNNVDDFKLTIYVYDAGSSSYNSMNLVIYSSNFKGSENYLPIGDIIVCPEVIGFDVNTIPVVLIKNDNKHSIPYYIPQNTRQTSYIGCDSKTSSYVSYVSTDANYQLIGLIKGNTTGVIGAVANTHLRSVNYGLPIPQPGLPALEEWVIGPWPPSGGENYWLGVAHNGSLDAFCPSFCMNYTSSFFSFMASPYSSGPDPAPVIVYDIIPTSLIMDFCNGNTPTGISNDTPLFNFIKDKFADKNICGSIDSDFCQGDNLVTDRCHLYCSSDKINCNNQYASYCGKDIITKENNDTCACFRSTAFYSKWRQDAIDAVRKTDPELAGAMDLLISPAINPVCDYPDCVSQNSQKPYVQGGIPPTCPSKNIQVCLQEINTDIGSGTDSKISPKTQMDCKQAVHNGDDPSSSNPPSPSSNKTIIYVIGITASVIVLLLIIGLVIVMLKK